MIPAPSDARGSLLERFFEQAADEAEGTVGRIRLAVLLLVLVRLLGVAGPEILQGSPKHWFTISVIAVGGGLSTALVGAVRRSRRKQPLLVASTVFDAVLAFLIILPSVAWPRVGYAGVLAAPDFAFWALVVVASGLRLSRVAALAGSGTAMAAVVGLVALDLSRNADRVVYGVGEVLLALVLLGGATLLALGLDGRVRGLVGRGAEEAVAKERARQRLGAYVSEEVAALALREPEAVMGGVIREVTVLFSDLRGFTRTGESLAPAELIGQLNAYLEAMVAAIHRHGGVVDKYMGDAILAVFGVPEARGDDARRAVAAAAAMQEALAEHNRQRAARGLPPLRHGIGLHQGPVVAGHVGTPERLQYTVIGDTVNVASRLQTATKDLGYPVLLSDAVLRRVAEEGGVSPAVVPLPPLELRGRSSPIGVAALADLDGAGPAGHNPRPEET